MKKRFSTTLLLVGGTALIPLAAQTPDNICRQVIGATGGSGLESGLRYDYTLGEAVVATFTAPDESLTLTQGFHQPECATVDAGEAGLPDHWQIQAFPNPTSDHLTVAYVSPEGGYLQGRIIGVDGRLLSDWQDFADPSGARLDCGFLPAGLYLLELRDPLTQRSAVIRFVKIQS